MKNLFYTILFGILIYPSCAGPKHGAPIEEPAQIESSFMNFWYYWNDNVKLARDYVAYDENNKQISKEDFLKKLSSGGYLPLRLTSKDSSVYYYELDSLNNHDEIARTIEQYAEAFYQYFKMEGKPLPDFNFVDLNGNVYNKKTCKGKIIVLNCWFIGCHACRNEMPDLNKLVDYYKNRKDIVFVSLAWDPEDELKKFLDTTKFNYAVVPDKRKYLSDTVIIPLGYPTQIIINKKGLVAEEMSDYADLKIALAKEAAK